MEPNTKRGNRMVKQEKKKQMQIVKQICKSGAFHDCTPLILQNGSYSDTDLNNMYIVSKFWYKVVNELFKRIKKIEYIFIHNRKKYVVYGFVPDKLPKMDNKFISAWSCSMFSTKTLRDDILTIFCEKCKKRGHICRFAPVVKCYFCNSNHIIPMGNIAQTAFNLWTLSQTAYLK